MKSIMQSKDGTCYLCKLLEGNCFAQTVQEHHVVFGIGNRKLSERYGLKVYLCVRHHLHDGGPYAVHRNKDIREMLCKEAQKAFMKEYPDKSFLQIFGKNWLDPEEIEEMQRKPREQNDGQGFIFLKPGEGVNYEGF